MVPFRKRCFFGIPVTRHRLAETAFSGLTNFSPVSPATMSSRQRSRRVSRDSPGTGTPMQTVPTAPIPVQTAEAVPTGRSPGDLLRRKKLPAMRRSVAIEG